MAHRLRSALPHVVGLILLVMGCLPVAHATPYYTLQVLEPLPGWSGSIGYAINSLGQAAGYCPGVYVPGQGMEYAATRWATPDDPLGLGTLGTSGTCSIGRGINDSGWVVGDSLSRPFVWDAVNGMRSMGVLPGHGTGYATAINNSGQAVGRCVDGSSNNHAFIWDETNGIEEITNDFGGPWSYAEDINDAGQVVGYATDGTSCLGYIWDDANGMTDLGNLGESYVWPHAVNDLGVVVGQARVTTVPSYEPAFIWDEAHGMRSLGTLPGMNTAVAYDINDRGVVVGKSSNHAWVYVGDTMYDLNDCIPDYTGWTLREAWEVNNSGQIVGWGYGPNGGRGFVLSLVPEPGTAALFVVGLALLSVRRRGGSGGPRSGV